MNIAIVIGISEYIEPQNNLPGCKKDAEIINSIINKTGKYESTLYVNSKLSSAELKEQLTDFIADNKSNKIDELFFYFTGHGEFHNNEFYYILSDFNELKRKQTSLQNDEVDSLIRTLNPNLVVKIIDACQSGKAYIKEANVVIKYFEKTQNKFNNCYFLNSSLKDQSSLQSDILSDFTLSFVKSIKEHNSSEIRYKDIIDYISDEFENNPTQTPFFVIQADYTEKFCIVNPQLKKYLTDLDLSSTITIESTVDELSLVDQIKKQASEYFTKEQAINLVNELKNEIDRFKCSSDLNEIYDLKISFADDYSQILDNDVIGKWLNEKKHSYFAKPTYVRKRKDGYNPSIADPALIFGGVDSSYEYVIDGFDVEVEVPYKTIIFNLESKFPNVESYTCRIVYLLSKRQIRFFYFITNFETINWDNRILSEDIEWFFYEKPISEKKDIIDGMKATYHKLEIKAKKELDEKFNKKEKPKE